MKSLILSVLFLAGIAIGTNVSAQTEIQYSYDSVGNRVSCRLVTPRSFSPLMF
ncbi:hypothetical protein [Bacteroides sp.]